MKKVVGVVFTLTLLVLYCAPKQDAAYFTQLGIDKMLYNVEDPETEGSFATDAVNYLEKAISLDSTYAPAYANLMYPYYIQIDFEEINQDTAIAKSRKALAKAQELAPDHPATLIADGFIKKNYDNDQSTAIALFKQAIEIDPDNTEAHRELGWSYFNEEKLDLALEQAEFALKADPKSRSAKYLLGCTYKQMGNFDQAIAAFQENLGENVNNLWDRSQLAHTFMQIGDYDKAEEVARQNLADYPNDNVAKNYAAYALGLNEKYDEALNLFKETNYPGAVAWVYACMGDKEKAYEGIIGLQSGENAEAWWTHYNIAEIYTALGEYDKAFNALNEALAKRKVDATEADLVDLGRTLATEPSLFALKDDPRFQAIIAQTGYTK